MPWDEIVRGPWGVTAEEDLPVDPEPDVVADDLGTLVGDQYP